MVWVSPEGQEEPLNAPPALYESPRLSPDGRYVAVEIRNPGNRHVVVYDLERGTTSPLTGADGSSVYPSWTPDGRRVVFRSSGQLYSKAADGTGEAEQLIAYPPYTVWPEAWSPNGQTLLVGVNSDQNIDVYTLAFGTATEIEPLLNNPSVNEISPQVSPNNRWIAYSTNETGRQEIYVRPFPDVDSGPRVQISQDGGAAALWSHDGTKLYFRPFDSRLMVVTVDTASPEFSAGIPEFLLDTTPYLAGSAAEGRIRTYDMGPDGRFLMVKEGVSQGIVVVLNWLQELTERVPVP